MREAPALDVINALEERGARIQAYDPQAMEAATALLPNVVMCQDSYAAAKGADALVIVTEWNQFRMLDLARLREKLKHPVIVDLRNIYEPGPMQEAGLTYVSVGR
jgi:UDPglucose 6-dehydrogenase